MSTLRVRIAAIALFSIGCLGAGPMTDESTTMIYAPNAVPLEWWVVNDTVMGGRSSSQWSDTGDSPAVFDGYLSLENNGGFTSVRSSQVVGLSPEHTTIRVRVRGDGRSYKFALRTSRIGRGVSYQYEFSTQSGEWIEADLPLSEFVPRWRGRRVSGAPALRPQDVLSVGFLLADKSEGRFRLEVAEISAFNSNSTVQVDLR